MPGATEVEIDLRPARYQSSLNCLRNLLEGSSKTPYILATVRTPKNETFDVQIRRADIYCIAFKGADSWYNFDDQQDGLGKPCGVGSNYAQLGTVGQVTLQDLMNLGELGRFQKGVVLNKRLCAILFAVVSEATRFATAATYFTGMTNQIPGGMNFEHMRSTYFNNWTKPPSDEDRVPGKVYHYTKNDILVGRDRG
jgi:hypothetical protein